MKQCTHSQPLPNNYRPPSGDHLMPTTSQTQLLILKNILKTELLDFNGNICVEGCIEIQYCCWDEWIKKNTAKLQMECCPENIFVSKWVEHKSKWRGVNPCTLLSPLPHFKWHKPFPVLAWKVQIVQQFLNCVQSKFNYFQKKYGRSNIHSKKYCKFINGRRQLKQIHVAIFSYPCNNL